MGRLQDIKRILSEPKNFFKKVPKDSIGSIYLFYLGLFGFYTVLSIIMSVLFYAIFQLLATNIEFFQIILQESNILFEVGILIISYVFAMGFVFFAVLLYHAYLFLFGARVSYLKSFQSYTYSFVPLYLFGWIPLVGFLVGYIWSIILLIIGVQRTHKLSLTRTIFAIIVVPLILITLAFATIVGLIILGVLFFTV